MIVCQSYISVASILAHYPNQARRELVRIHTCPLSQWYDLQNQTIYSAYPNPNMAIPNPNQQNLNKPSNAPPIQFNDWPDSANGFEAIPTSQSTILSILI